MINDELVNLAWTQVWQLTALIALVAALDRLAARRRPHLTYMLWLVVLAKCLTPPVVTSTGGVFCWLQPLRLVSAAREASPSGPNEFAQRPLETTSVVDRRAPAATGADGDEHAMPETSTAAVKYPPIHSLSAIAPHRLHGTLLWSGIFWLAGTAVLAAVAGIRLGLCIRRFRRSAVECRPELAALVADLAQRLCVRRPVRLLITFSRVGPAVVGLWRPTIVLPMAVVQGKSARELEPILAHELIHVRRGDLCIGLGQVVAQAVWWFHPLVWLANRLSTRAAEACCDEEAVAALGCDPERYARSLLAVLEHKRGLVSVPAFPGMRPVDVTRERLERIMKIGQGCHTHTPWWCWLVLVLATAVTLPGAAFVTHAEEELQSPPAKADVQSAIEADGPKQLKDKSPIAGASESNRTADPAGSQKRDRRQKLLKLAPNELVTLTYSVADLVVPVEHMYVAASKDLAFIASSDERKSEPQTGSPDEVAAKREDHFTELMELISSTVAPESWEVQKGPGSMMPYRATLSLVIRQTPAVHDQIAGLLSQLRRLQDLVVTLQLDVISIAGGASSTPLKFENDPVDAKEGISYLIESELKSFQELVEKSDGAAMMKGPTIILQNGQGGELKLRRRLLARGTSPLPALHVVPTISADRSAIRLQFAVGASKPLDALARSHVCKITKGQSLLVDVTEELAWNHVGGPMGAQAASIRRSHKVSPAERVLLLITPQVVEAPEEQEGWLTDGPDKTR